MIYSILGGIALAGITYIIGYYKGKSAQKAKQLKKGVEDAIKSNNRQAKRRNDDIAVIRTRMRKYTRK